MNFSKEIMKVISLLGIEKVDSVIPIKENVYNTSCVYQINLSNKKFILKVFNNSNEMGITLLQREKMAYNMLKNRFSSIPMLLIEQENFLLIEYCDDSEKINIDDLITNIANIHNALNSSTHFKGSLKFDFFGNGENIVQRFIQELGLIENKIFNQNGTNYLVKKINALLNKESNYLCHGDLTKNNLRANRNCMKIIDFECLSNLPLEFDLAILCSYDILSTHNNISLAKCIESYLNKLNFEYSFNYQIFHDVLIFDSVRKCRFARRSNLVNLEVFYFKRLLKFLKEDAYSNIESININYEDCIS